MPSSNQKDAKTADLCAQAEKLQEEVKSLKWANAVNDDEYQAICSEFGLPKDCGCNKIGSQKWCALAPFNEIKKLRSQVEKDKAEIAGLLGKVHLFDPHPNAEGCPTFYDGCNCTVENLVHNIQRAEAAEQRIAILEEALNKIIGLRDRNDGGEWGSVYEAVDLARTAMTPSHEKKKEEKP